MADGGLPEVSWSAVKAGPPSQNSRTGTQFSAVALSGRTALCPGSGSSGMAIGRSERGAMLLRSGSLPASWRKRSQPIGPHSVRRAIMQASHADRASDSPATLASRGKADGILKSKNTRRSSSWSQPGSTTAGLNYYRANHRNPPFNDRHPASTIPTSWSAKEITAGAKTTVIKTPTFVIWACRTPRFSPVI